MTRPCNILRRSTILEGKHTLSNHLTSIRPNNVDSQNAISLLISNELDHTLSIQVGLGARVGREGEAGDVVRNAGSLDLSLGLTNPSGLGVGVHDAGNGAVVDVAVALGYVLDGGNTLLLGLVGQHGAEGGVTDGTDVGDLGAVLLVDDDAATVVNIDTEVLETETGGVGATTNGDENDIGVELWLSV